MLIDAFTGGGLFHKLEQNFESISSFTTFRIWIIVSLNVSIHKIPTDNRHELH